MKGKKIISVAVPVLFLLPRRRSRLYQQLGRLEEAEADLREMIRLREDMEGRKTP